MPRTLKRLRYGDLLIEVEKRAHSINLQKAESFLDTPVKVTPHRTLNSCKGVVRNPEFALMTDQELLDCLAPQCVSDARRFTRKVNDQIVNTNAFVLTFDLPVLPKEVRLVNWLNVPVDVYIPSPLRCYHCQRFGHHKDRCRKYAVCARCGDASHTSDSCTGTEWCINFDGNHSDNSRNCPTWKLEKEVQRVRVEQKLSFLELEN